VISVEFNILKELKIFAALIVRAELQMFFDVSMFFEERTFDELVTHSLEKIFEQPSIYSLFTTSTELDTSFELKIKELKSTSLLFTT
jgi:hypothetical protein